MNSETIVGIILFLLFAIRSIRNWDEISFFLPPLFKPERYDIKKTRIVTLTLFCVLMAGVIVMDIMTSESQMLLIMLSGMIIWPCLILFCRKK